MNYYVVLILGPITSRERCRDSEIANARARELKDQGIDCYVYASRTPPRAMDQLEKCEKPFRACMQETCDNGGAK